LRGHLEEKVLGSFVDAGFSPAQAFEVIVGISISTMTNYAGNIAKPPLDEVFKSQMWAAPKQTAPDLCK
jgi:alkylhydroperoxidase family enzyme